METVAFRKRLNAVVERVAFRIHSANCRDRCLCVTKSPKFDDEFVPAMAIPTPAPSRNRTCLSTFQTIINDKGRDFIFTLLQWVCWNRVGRVSEFGLRTHENCAINEDPRLRNNNNNVWLDCEGGGRARLAGVLGWIIRPFR